MNFLFRRVSEYQAQSWTVISILLVCILINGSVPARANSVTPTPKPFATLPPEGISTPKALEPPADVPLFTNPLPCPVPTAGPADEKIAALLHGPFKAQNEVEKQEALDALDRTPLSKVPPIWRECVVNARLRLAADRKSLRARQRLVDEFLALTDLSASPCNARAGYAIAHSYMAVMFPAGGDAVPLPTPKEPLEGPPEANFSSEIAARVLEAVVDNCEPHCDDVLKCRMLLRGAYKRQKMWDKALAQTEAVFNFDASKLYYAPVLTFSSSRGDFEFIDPSVAYPMIQEVVEKKEPLSGSLASLARWTRRSSLVESMLDLAGKLPRDRQSEAFDRIENVYVRPLGNPELLERVQQARLSCSEASKQEAAN